LDENIEKFSTLTKTNLLGCVFENHVLEMEPSVKELAKLEHEAQTSFLKLKRKKWAAVH
jgi:hypothetical protein